MASGSGHDTGRKPGLARRRERMSKDEAAERMLDVAMDEIKANGLFVNMEHLSFEEVIRDAGVARSAAYRAWSSKEQFFEELFLKLVASEVPGGHTAYGPTVRLVAQTALDNISMVATPQGRRELFVELCRVGAEQNFRTLYQSPEWQTYVAVAATLGSIDDGDLQTQAQQLLFATEQAFVEQMSGFYMGMASILGFRPKPGITFETITVLGGAIIDGLVLEGNILPRQIPDTTVEADPFGVGREQEWSVAALGYTAMIDSLLDFDPERELDPAAARDLLAAMLTQSIGTSTEAFTSAT